jgi:hypothetical protein
MVETTKERNALRQFNIYYYELVALFLTNQLIPRRHFTLPFIKLIYVLNLDITNIKNVGRSSYFYHLHCLLLLLLHVHKIQF